MSGDIAAVVLLSAFTTILNIQMKTPYAIQNIPSVDDKSKRRAAGKIIINPAVKSNFNKDQAK